ncbi:MAG: hypothetical protein ACLPTF_05930 [Steroidobacteraceae bacterium]
MQERIDPQTEKIVSMLGAISSRIEAALIETNAPAATLAETAHSMRNATQTLTRCLFDFSGSPARVFQDLMVLHDEFHTQASKAVTAAQFHDRLVQSLTHVCCSLSYLAEFISSSTAPKSQAEWDQLHERVRGILSMERERVLHDLLSRGASPDEKQAAIEDHQGSGPGKVELF